MGNGYPPGWAGQAERLACHKRRPNAFLRAEAHTHFCGREREVGRMQRMPFQTQIPSVGQFLICKTKKRIFLIDVEVADAPALFGRVSRCVPRAGTRQYPCPVTALCACFGALCQKLKAA